MKTGSGFLNYEGMDLPMLQQEKLRRFEEALGRIGLAKAPKI